MKRRFHIEPREDGLHVEPTTGKVWCREDLRVLYADTDQAGVVYHANYLRFFEQGRAAVIRKSGVSYRDIEALGVFQPIVHLGMTFESYAGYDEPLSVYARPRSLATVKFSYDYVVWSLERERVVVHGFTEHCCIDREHRPQMVDPVTVKLFASFGVHGPAQDRG